MAPQPRARMYAAVVGVALAATFVGACDEGDDNSSNRTGAPGIVPTVADALQGAGTPIGDGFSVVEGSWLVGGTFPYPSYPGDSRTGWAAVILVGDEPLSALQRYLRQARAARFTDFVPNIEAPLGPCVGETDPRPKSDETSTVVDLDRAPARADRLLCALYARRSIPEGGFDLVSMDLSVGPPPYCQPGCTESYSSYLAISVYSSPYTGGPVLPEYGPTPEPPDVVALPVPALPPAPRGIRLPQVDEPIGSDQAFFDGLVVAPGSYVVAPGSTLVGGGTGSYSVVLRITGDPRSVVEGYLDQLRDVCCPGGRSDTDGRIHEQPFAGSAYLYGSVARAGGIDAGVVTTLIAEGAPVFALVALGSD